MRIQNDRLNSILKIMDNLPENQTDSIIDSLYAKLTACEQQADVSAYALKGNKVVACRKCGSVHIVKNGKDRHGHTRYLCRDCGKTFGEMTNTVVAGTHKSASTWKDYIRSLLEGQTLALCAARCRISIPTAFVWRHKILDALEDNSFNYQLQGMIEIDEAWVRISYKGNHSKSKSFTMPRKPCKRGNDNRRPSTTNKVCVLCAVERNKAFSAIIPCRGAINSKLLEKCLTGRLAEDCIVMTDGLHAYDLYFKNTNLTHVVLPAKGKNKKPVVKGAYHLNNVNALHSRFKFFLGRYHGVSTKYLGHYLSLFLWLENNKVGHKFDLLCDRVSGNGLYITAAQLRQFSPVPDVAPAA